jgi:hypothetical protein
MFEITSEVIGSEHVILTHSDSDHASGLTLVGCTSKCLLLEPPQTTFDVSKAATIVYAAERGVVAILDEKKGTRISASRFPDLNSISTVDLLLHPKIRESLGDDGFADAVFAALRDAQMAVFPQHRDETLRLIVPKGATRHCE